MTDSLRVKLEGLISRAVHEGTPIEEAKTCALIAIKLMVANKMQITLPSGAPGLGSSPPAEPFPRPNLDPFASFLWMFLDLARQEATRRRQQPKTRVVDPNRVQEEVDEAFRKWNTEAPGVPRSEKKRRQRRKPR